MYSYKIIEENEDISSVLIEKSGVTVEFTLDSINVEQDALRKYLKEFAANKVIKQTMKENIEEHHPFVETLTDEELFTAALYQQTVEAINQYDEKIEQFEKQLEGSEKEVIDIITQIGMSPVQVEAISPTETDEEDIEEAMEGDVVVKPNE